MRIFIATPISCFKNARELKQYKKDIYALISVFEEKHIVCSEVNNINDKLDYDTPEKSIGTDLRSIQECDTFILHYPKQVPTSALMELGMAIAMNKRIIIITPDKLLLPYLALGVTAQCPNSHIIESACIDDKLVNKIMSLL